MSLRTQGFYAPWRQPLLRLSIHKKKGHTRITEDVIKETRACIEEVRAIASLKMRAETAWPRSMAKAAEK